ncbi:MAG: hypothetical protein GY943_07860 [Chloroflexi bacterium]|nr:hypothetical protein [Chloroflexota bacterium]
MITMFAACNPSNPISSENDDFVTPNYELAETTPTSVAIVSPTVDSTSTIPNIDVQELPTSINNTIFLYAIHSSNSVEPTPSLPTPTPYTINENLGEGTVTISHTVAANFEESLAWQMKALPIISSFNAPILDTIYGEGFSGDGLSNYLLNFRPQLSPNGRYLLIPGIGGYQNPNGDLGTGLWLADLEEGTSHQLLPQTKVTTWSPNSKSLAYIEDGTLYTLSIINGSQPEPLFTHPNLNWLYARWSPDGQWIAVITTTMDGSQSATPVETLWLVSPEGGENKQLVTIQGSAIEHTADEISWSDDVQYLLIRNAVYNLTGEQISPDYLALTAWVPAQTSLLFNSQDGLRLTTTTGQEIATISNMKTKVWAFSHDGQYLAYTQPNGEQTDIYIFDLTQQTNHLISTMQTKDDIDMLRILRWSSDNDYLILDNWRDDSPIWTIQANVGSTAEIILQDGFLIEIIPQIK